MHLSGSLGKRNAKSTCRSGGLDAEARRLVPAQGQGPTSRTPLLRGACVRWCDALVRCVGATRWRGACACAIAPVR